MSIIGKPAPAFSGPAALNGDITNISLGDYAGKWLVLFFYPLDFTFVCPTEIVAFNNALPEFQAVGAELLGCSVDSVHTHLAYLRAPREEAGLGGLDFPLLSDITKQIATDYDVLNGAVALRGVFIIDPKGNVQSAIVNNLSVGRNVNEVLRTLKAFQYTVEHGEVCPANWAEGAEGMAASLDGVKGVIND
jgi:alkyl hydroperoxide reductase subunit AhpC